MTATKIEVYSLKSPLERLYEQNRRVRFIGGEGIVLSSNFEGGTWKYLVEMPQGRAGAETMVFLNERELCAA